MNTYISKKKILLFIPMIILLFGLNSCDKKYKFKINSPDKIQISESLSFDIEEVNGNSYEKVLWSLDGKSLDKNHTIDISEYVLGNHLLSAEIFYQDISKKINKNIIFLAAKTPDIYDFEIVAVYPHDPNAYTQGLEFHNGFLYESTGHNGASSLRKVALQTGKILQKIDVSSDYFAEGMTIFGEQIFQLTWQSKIGFVYDLNSFKQIKTFPYNQSKEGWGMTHDGKYLIKSDGTEKIWFLDPETLEEKYHIEAYTNTQSVKDLNELEYINGKVYANVWQKNIILILNPVNGTIEGVADMNELEKEVRKSQNLVPSDEVLNGIAYDEKNDRIYVTGKHWGKLFEIKLHKRNH